MFRKVRKGPSKPTTDCPEVTKIKIEFKDVIGSELLWPIAYTGIYKHSIDVITDFIPTYNGSYRLSMEIIYGET